MNKSKPKLIEYVVEIRYERGYRYLDRCGDAMLILEDALSQVTGKLWMTGEMLPKGALLKCPDLDAEIRFDTGSMALIHKLGEIEVDYSTVAQTAISTLVGRFDLRTPVRFGNRSVFLIGTDSVEEADSTAVKLSPFTKWPLDDESKFAPIDTEVIRTCESPDGKFGFRFALQSSARVDAPEKADDRVRMPARLLPSGQKEALLSQLKRQAQRDKSPVAGVRLDLDVYEMRPDRFEIAPFLKFARSIEADIIKNVVRGEL